MVEKVIHVVLELTVVIKVLWCEEGKGGELEGTGGGLLYFSSHLCANIKLDSTSDFSAIAVAATNAAATVAA